MTSAIVAQAGSKRRASPLRTSVVSAALPAETATVIGPFENFAGVMKSPGDASDGSARFTHTPWRRGVANDCVVHLAGISRREHQRRSVEISWVVPLFNSFNRFGELASERNRNRFDVQRAGFQHPRCLACGDGPAADDDDPLLGKVEKDRIRSGHRCASLLFRPRLGTGRPQDDVTGAVQRHSRRGAESDNGDVSVSVCPGVFRAACGGAACIGDAVYWAADASRSLRSAEEPDVFPRTASGSSAFIRCRPVGM